MMAKSGINDTALAGELARRLDNGELVPREGDSPDVQGLLQTYARLQTIAAEPDAAFERLLCRSVSRRAQPASPRLAARLSGGFSWLRRRPLLVTATILLLVAIVVSQSLYIGPSAGELLAYIPRSSGPSVMAGSTGTGEYGWTHLWQSESFSSYTPDSAEPPNRMVAQNAFLVISVEDQAATLVALQEIVRTQHGFIVDSSSTLTTKDYSDSTVRFLVPAAAFEETIAQVKALGIQVIAERTTSSDVTSSYVDLDARLRNLELAETELQDLLQAAQERGDTAKDILAIYSSLSDIRGQIEQLRGQKKLLEESVAMAQIEVILAPKETTSGFNPGQLFGDAWGRLGQFLQQVAVVLIYGLVFLLPVVLIVGIVVLVRRANRRHSPRGEE